jgi:hypothetical protein
MFLGFFVVHGASDTSLLQLHHGVIHLLAACASPGVSSDQPPQLSLAEGDNTRIWCTNFRELQEYGLHNFVGDDGWLAEARMDVDRHWALDTVSILECVGDDAVASSRFLRVEAEERPFDAKDGDLFPQSLKSARSLLLHLPLSHIIEATANIAHHRRERFRQLLGWILAL